ncbi:MAG: hypothetical protein WBA12_11040 [Catalinimonas sp.]
MRHLIWALCAVLFFPARAQLNRALIGGDGDTFYALVLDKPGLRKRLRFYPGEELTFKLKEDDYMYRTTIQGGGPGYVVLMDAAVPVEEFRRIYVEKEGYGFHLLKTGARNGTGAGIAVGALGLVMLPFMPDAGLQMLTGGAVLFGVGQALRLTYRRSYRIDRRRTLRTMETQFRAPINTR